MPTRLLWNLFCLILIAAVLRSARHALRQTTLVAPYRWSLFAMGLIGMVELWLHGTTLDPATTDAIRYVAAAATCCPVVAILGAKRPQHVAWQFIVASLWVVLVMPVGETLILWRGGQLDIGPAREWLIVVLLCVGTVNYLPTRFGIAAILATTGQAALLSPQLPVFLPAWLGDRSLGAGILAAAALLAWVRREGRRDYGWDRVWTDFRDAFGTVWGLRAIERINATASLCDWDKQLGWFGFAARPQSRPNPRQAEELEQCLRTTLRRFVSEEWIDGKLRATDMGGGQGGDQGGGQGGGQGETL